jgi:hypothetical protein
LLTEGEWKEDMVVLETCQSPSRRDSEKVQRFEVDEIEEDRAVSSELIQRLRTLSLGI